MGKRLRFFFTMFSTSASHTSRSSVSSSRNTIAQVVACPLFLPDRDPEASFPSICIVARKEMRHAHMVPFHPNSCMTEVHVAPCDWPAGGVCKGSHAKRAESTLRPSLRLLPLLVLTFPRFFLPPYVYVSVKEKEQRGCSIVRKLAEKYPAQGGEPVGSELRWTVRFAGWGRSAPTLVPWEARV
jgi:hypothetical protein